MKILKGLCQCGCGEETNIAKRADSRKGWVRGEPLRFIANHHLKAIRHKLKQNMYKIDNKTDCWIWQGATHQKGYGRRVIGKKQIFAHRFYYEKYRGKIPRELELDHLCRNPLCVNPYHLEAVTHVESMRRGKSTKLTIRQVKEIRYLSKTTEMTTYKLSEMFRVSRGHISNITNNHVWVS